MTPLICIDPGVTKGHYWAAGEDGKITHAGLHLEALSNRGPLTPRVARDGTYFGRLVIEIPEIVFGCKPAADIILLARAAERVAAWWTIHSYEGAAAPVEYVTPAQWKAGDKNGHQLAVWDALTPDEQAVLLKLAPRSTAAKIRETLSRRCVNGTKSEYPFGNAIDAAGIYLYTVGRIDKFGRKAT